MALLPRDDRRIILHFDYDCFYASVFEVEQPVLRTLPLAVQQKQIVVTCNYEARRRGLRKLQLIKEAKQICPDVVIVLGEDLTKFRDASKGLYLFLREFVWGGRVERLGFDEVFLDVTDMVAYNVELLNRNDLEHSFFHLDLHDPTAGFAYNATCVSGPTYPVDFPPPALADSDSAWLHTRLLVASHLATYLRSQLEEQRGYTATVGVSTSKLLAKLVGNVHKPNSQTTLLPPYTTESGSTTQSNVLTFLDSHTIGKIPGIGSKLTQKLTSYLVSRGTHSGSASDAADAISHCQVTVRDVRCAPGMGPVLLEKLLGGQGSPKDIGGRVWRLLHGVDSAEVLQARDLPTQISIEDSYGRLDTIDGVQRELLSLVSSLVRRMRTDLTEKDPLNESGETSRRWVAYPKTFRLSTRARSSTPSEPHSFNRISRSAPLPSFVFSLTDGVDAVAERLVDELAMSMFRKLHPARSGWNLRLVNVAVTNMVDGAGDRKQSSGRDIGKMFQQQALGREVAIPAPIDHSRSNGSGKDDACDNGTGAWEESEDEEVSMTGVTCTICRVQIPHFAMVAHEVYHAAPD
ncbi:hypothetical protein BDV59DRAFT_60646 [Aspergillus ambiguus]|uniref:putative DNA polymerase iota n=1 Tax=Aspergillus ambiguus TaxID=176160 RepID=UPI003CCDB5AD